MWNFYCTRRTADQDILLMFLGNDSWTWASFLLIPHLTNEANHFLIPTKFKNCTQCFVCFETNHLAPKIAKNNTHICVYLYVYAFRAQWLIIIHIHNCQLIHFKILLVFSQSGRSYFGNKFSDSDSGSDCSILGDILSAA